MLGYWPDSCPVRGDRTDLLICDEPGYLTFSRTGAERLFQVFVDRYENDRLPLTSNLAFSKWVQVFQGERMTTGCQTAEFRVRSRM